MAELDIHARLATDPFDPRDELSAIEAAGAGALASMIGRTREARADGAAIHGLFLDHHPRLTPKSLDQIARAAAARFDLVAIRIVHRCGQIAPGEAIVFVAAAAAHRRAAIDAVDYLMDRLKTDAFFWKREDAVDGSRWIEPSEADRADRARWDGQAQD